MSSAGGGVQAAAWTARVLVGLQEDVGADFGRAIRFISAVSGGAVGAMYFVDRYTEKGPPADAALDAVLTAACSSGLSAVAWGLVYPDLLRLVWPFPISRELDRAWALEQSWSRHLINPHATLGDWRRGVDAGWRPATAFNATVAESGERLLLSTADLSPSGAATTFAERYREADVAVVRAARLAATYPYVTPMARAEWSEPPADEVSRLPRDHLADGGYHDSSGVATLIDWLLQAEPKHALVDRVLVIRVLPARVRELS